MASTLGTILYVSLLLVNAVAILNEERFLARGECYWERMYLSDARPVGWSPSSGGSFEAANFSSAGDPNVKARIVNLISAVRTLLRGTC